MDGVIEELDPPNRLVMTWHVLYDAAMSEEPASRVEWIVELVGEDLTRLRLEHGDLAGSPLTWANVKDGWFYVLDGTAHLRVGERHLIVETGQAAEFDTMTPHWLLGQGGPVDVLTIFDRHGERAHLHPTA